MTVQSDVGPFAIVPEWLIRTGVSAGAVRVFVELALMADRKSAVAWPSRRTLANRCGVASLRTIDAWLAELETVGALTKERRDRGDQGRSSSLYHVQFAARGGAEIAPTPRAADCSQNQNQLEPEPRTIKNTLKFDEFWTTYPRKVGKGKARSAFEEALEKTDAKTLIEAAKVYASSVIGDDSQYIAHPASWLNAERWEDEYEEVKPATYYEPPPLDEEELKGFLSAVAEGPWSR